MPTNKRSVWLIAVVCWVAIGLGLQVVGAVFCDAFGAEFRYSLSPCRYEGGGRFTSIAIDPHDPQVVFIGSDVAGVFKSVDGGNSFEPRGRGLESFAVADLAVDPNHPGRVLVLTDSGLYLSTDQGEHWRRISEETRYRARFCGSRLMVFQSTDLWVGTDENGVFQITLEGTEAAIRPVSGLEGIKVNALTVANGELAAGTDRGVMRWLDGRWAAWNQGLEPDHRHISDLVSPGKGHVYLVERSQGAFRWNQDQNRWESRRFSATQMLTDRPKGFKAIAVHPTNPDVVFLASYPETWPYLLYGSRDGGKTWTRVSAFNLAPKGSEHSIKGLVDVEEIAFSPHAPDTLFLTDWLQVWRSTDRGGNWQQLLRGLPNTVVNDLKVSPVESKTIYFADADNGLVVTEDDGETWTRYMNGVPDGAVQEVEISSLDPKKLFLLARPWQKANRVFVFRSSDGGKSWKDVGFPLPNKELPQLGFVDGLPTNLKIDPTSDEVLYVGTNGYGVFKSLNGGRDWQPINNGLDKPYIKGPGALRVHPVQPNILYASTLQGGVYKSEDAGTSWKKLMPGEPFTFGMAIDPMMPSRLVVASAEKGVLVSEDNGLNWLETRLPGASPSHIAANAVAFYPGIPSCVFVGTLAYDFKAADGLFVSVDAGRTFVSVPMDLPKVSLNTLGVRGGQNPAIFLGFNGLGAYRLDVTSAIQ
jgi:photosystem II stability/assembly factor-like uncharacterized protein